MCRCLLEAQLSHQTSELSSVSARVFDELSAVRLRGDHASQQAAAATQQATAGWDCAIRTRIEVEFVAQRSAKFNYRTVLDAGNRCSWLGWSSEF